MKSYKNLERLQCQIGVFNWPWVFNLSFFVTPLTNLATLNFSHIFNLWISCVLDLLEIALYFHFGPLQI